MSRLRLAVLPLLPFVSLALSQPSTPASASASGHFSASGEQVHIYNLIGRVEVVPGGGSSVQVDLTPGGRDGARLGTKTWSSGGTFFVVTYPSDHLRSPNLHWGSSTTLQVAKDGTFGDHPKRSGWLDRRVRIDGKGDGLEAWCDLRVSVPKGQKISVHLGVGDLNASNVNGDLVLDTAEGSVTVNNEQGDLLIDTGSGDIAVTGAAGNLSLDSGSGSVRATRVSGDRLLFDTGSGDVVVNGARGTRLMADTGSGSITLSGVSCPTVHLDTGSGDVRLGLTGDISQLDIDTGSGSVTIEAPPTLGASLHIETGSGDIASDFPLRVTRRESDTLLATVGDGHGHIVIDTGSGDVRIRRAAPAN